MSRLRPINSKTMACPSRLALVVQVPKVVQAAQVLKVVPVVQAAERLQALKIWLNASSPAHVAR